MPRKRVVLTTLGRNPEYAARSLPPGILAHEYAPYSLRFPRAAAIVHHGGIGTTGLAMRAGRPMLVVPHAHDQPDNADRAARLGIARVLPRHRYTASRIASELSLLFNDPAIAKRAIGVQAGVQKEAGVRTACDTLERMLAKVNAKSPATDKRTLRDPLP